MSELEAKIRELATRGEISHISLSPSQNETKWRGSYAMCSTFGVSFAEDEDPCRALLLSMTTAKLKPRARTKREDAAAEARGPAVIPQETVDAQPAAEDVEDLM